MLPHSKLYSERMWLQNTNTRSIRGPSGLCLLCCASVQVDAQASSLCFDLDLNEQKGHGQHESRAGHKLLLFSTMTTMLDAVEEVLEWLGHRWERLDGTTQASERGPLLQSFSSDPEVWPCPCPRGPVPLSICPCACALVQMTLPSWPCAPAHRSLPFPQTCPCPCGLCPCPCVPAPAPWVLVPLPW